MWSAWSGGGSACQVYELNPSIAGGTEGPIKQRLPKIYESLGVESAIHKSNRTVM